MARFDPNTYPDRLAFEANARRIRTEELGRLFDPLMASLAAAMRQWGHRVPQLVAAPARAHGHSTH